MSKETRKRFAKTARLDVQFGKSDMEYLDIFPAQKPGAPVYVFIHGGYWYSLDKSDYSYVAEGLYPHDISTVVINHDLAPNVSMTEIVRQNRAAFTWVMQHASEFNGDGDRIVSGGHSAGGQLLAMVMAAEWKKSAGIPRDLVKGGCAISGIFDLVPVQRSYLNKTLNMSATEAEENSPLRLDYDYPAPLLLISGEQESEEYERQTYEMHGYWSGLGFQSEIQVGRNLNHFNIVDQLVDPQSEFVTSQLEFFSLI
ncbi:MAG: alpha/beta hydrolase [Gammaproteobacteria bacterium]